jgi:hypothetical protein
MALGHCLNDLGRLNDALGTEWWRNGNPCFLIINLQLSHFSEVLLKTQRAKTRVACHDNRAIGTLH